MAALLVCLTQDHGSRLREQAEGIIITFKATDWRHKLKSAGKSGKGW